MVSIFLTVEINGQICCLKLLITQYIDTWEIICNRPNEITSLIAEGCDTQKAIEGQSYPLTIANRKINKNPYKLEAKNSWFWVGEYFDLQQAWLSLKKASAKIATNNSIKPIHFR